MPKVVTREEMVIEARSWIGTPYRLGARVKGSGCDCATLLAECLIACELVAREELGVYSHDWFHHTQEDKYMLRILRNGWKYLDAIAYRSESINPGNLILTYCAGSRVFNHGGIVTKWPFLVHAGGTTVAEVDASKHPMWGNHKVRVFDPFKQGVVC